MTTDLRHIGVARRSGRYPWGSGGETLSTIDKLGSEGFSEKEIAESLGMSTTELRNVKTLLKGQQKEADRLQVVKLKDKGMSISAISDRTKLAPSTIRDLLKPTANAKFRIIRTIADILKKAIEKDKYIDVGDGVEVYLGISETKLRNAIHLLKQEGYVLHYLKEPQLGTGKNTRYKILSAPDTPWKEVAENKTDISFPGFTTDDGGRTFSSIMKVNNMSSNDLHVVYNSDKDGLIELRRDIPELSLGSARYAQVRIGIDGTHYLKGVAVYGDNIPPGSNMVFHTSKSKKATKLAALKEQEAGEDNPFGSSIKPQKTVIDSNGNQVTSALNVVYEEGDWNKWGRTLSSQILSKQNPALAKTQLGFAYDRRAQEFEEIMSLTNPIVKQHLLYDFANEADSAAVKLKAAALPRQTTSVLIPEPSLKINEAYAPNYNNGDVVSLMRHPHGGKFEIPTLVVNNKNKNARSILGSDAADVIAIHPDVAKRLSGADFDGDTAIVVPNKNNRIQTAPPLAGLKQFDPISAYPPYDGMVRLDKKTKERLMGEVSNLITDMSVQGAPASELARAVRHSMVVIDAEKHELNYKQSFADNGIRSLKAKYQQSPGYGASTLISRAGSQARVPLRRDGYDIDPKTGAKIFTEIHKTYVDKNGQTVERTTRSKKMYEVDDAMSLSSGTRIEKVYAEHANKLKKLGDDARLAYVETQKPKRSPTAARTYANEVASLDAKLRRAVSNRPLERKAQILANSLYKAKLERSDDMSPDRKKKERGRALIVARSRIGAEKGKKLIDITPREWEAIQMGSITPTKLQSILRNADSDQVRAYATPRTTRALSGGKISRIRALQKNSYTNAEIASALGISVQQILNIED